MTTDRQILVIGGNGKTGARVAQRLHSHGIGVRTASRSSTPAFDWEDPSTWGPALQGADAAYISYYPDLAAPGAPEAIAALAEQALAAGTRRLVLLSGRGEEEAQRAEAGHRAPTGPWCAARGSTRTSARATSASRCWPASWHCPPARSWNRSWTPTTSPTWRWRR